ncbi:hypothetical protein [Spirillospora sp. NPDC047279]|uniref:hypothetical protein n=1 Tax=Spirillospora sp. NPDC047279 TaxID=3155478 RepID=UPI0033E963D0
MTDDPVVPAHRQEERDLRVTRIALGAAGNVVGILESAVRIALGASPKAEPHTALRFVPDVVIGLGMDTRRRSARLRGVIRDRVTSSRGADVLRLPVSGPVAGARRRLESWSAQGRAERLRGEREAAVAGRALLQAAVGAVLDRMDLDAVVARVDPNQVAERLDIDAVVERLDLKTIVDQVLREIDVPAIVRESSETMTQETIDAFRAQSMRADGLVDRITGRRRGDPGAPRR